jgi:acetylornithine deacetylase/succinyl-diaminopimelate desuccinylase-like protein
MNVADIKALFDARISRARAKELLIELVKVPSPQTELLEDEPLLKTFIRTAIEPRLRAMGFADIRYDAMGNLIATYGAGTSGRSLMFIGNAMNQPPRPCRIRTAAMWSTARNTACPANA